MKIKETGVHPRGEPPLKKADGGRVAFGGGGMDASQDDFGGNTASDTGPGGGAQDTGPSHTGDSIGGSDPRDLGFIDGPTVNPNLSKKGPDIISAPPTDPRFDGYNPSTFDPGNKNIIQKTTNIIKKAVTNPFVKTLGINFLAGPLGLTKQLNMINKARAVKSLYDNMGSIVDASIEDEIDQTTALYKDGGLASMFMEKR